MFSTLWGTDIRIWIVIPVSNRMLFIFFRVQNWYLPDPNYRCDVKEETPEEYKERLRRSREEQLEAQARRKQESIARKIRQEMEREQGNATVFNTELLYSFCNSFWC